MIEMLQYGFMQRAFIERNLTGRDRTIDRNHDRLKENVHDRRCTLMHPWQVLLWACYRNQSDLRSNGNLSVLQPWELKQSEERSQDILRWRYRSLCQQGSDFFGILSGFVKTERTLTVSYLEVSYPSAKTN